MQSVLPAHLDARKFTIGNLEPGQIAFINPGEIVALQSAPHDPVILDSNQFSDEKRGIFYVCVLRREEALVVDLRTMPRGFRPQVVQQNESEKFIGVLYMDGILSILPPLHPGQAAFTTPWHVVADSEGNLWIDGDCPTSSLSHGTMELKIRPTLTHVEVKTATFGDYKITSLPFLKPHGYVPVLLVDEI